MHGTEPGVASALQHEPGGRVLRESGGRRTPALRPVAPYRVPAGPAAPAVTQPQHRTPPHCHRLAAPHGRHSQGIGCRASRQSFGWLGTRKNISSVIIFFFSTYNITKGVVLNGIAGTQKSFLLYIFFLSRVSCLTLGYRGTQKIASSTLFFSCLSKGVTWTIGVDGFSGTRIHYSFFFLRPSRLV